MNDEFYNAIKRIKKQKLVQQNPKEDKFVEMYLVEWKDGSKDSWVPSINISKFYAHLIACNKIVHFSISNSSTIQNGTETNVEGLRNVSVMGNSENIKLKIK